MVAVGRHYGCKVETCVAYDPESKGGVEATVRIAKADLVPTLANLLAAYASFAELAGACERFCEQVNNREHRESRAVPMLRLARGRELLHVLPAEPHTLAFGGGAAGQEGLRRSAGRGAVFHPARLARPDRVVPRPG